MTMPSLASRFGGRPLALAPRALEPLLAATPIEARSDLALEQRSGGFAVTDSRIAVVPVIGPLVSRGDWLTELFGIGDYGAVGNAIADAFAAPATRGVLMEIDSPGGEVGGLFDLTYRITASDKYRLSPAATVVGDEGAEVASAVLIEAVDATASDQTGLVVVRGPAIVSKAALVYDASVDDAPKTAAKHAELSAAGIVPRDTA